jgi:hypothetical protein
MAVIFISMGSPDQGGQNGGKMVWVGCVLSVLSSF